MLTDWNFWLSIVTVAVASLALIQSRQQITLSNKQHLFDKRLDIYLVAVGLIQLCRNNDSLFEQNEKDEPYFQDIISNWFKLLTNNSYLEQITIVIKNPLNEPHHKYFLIKIENLKDVATKIQFLFSNTASEVLSDFVLSYQKLLSAMYKFQIVLVNRDEVAKKYELTQEESQQKIKVKQARDELQTAIDKLKQAYTKLIKENVEDQIKKQIKL